MTDRDEHTAVIGMVSDTVLREQLAAEIARLRHDIERHLAITTEQQTEIERLRAQRDRLLAALRKISQQDYDAGYTPEAFAEAVLSNWPGILDDAAIAAVEEKP